MDEKLNKLEAKIDALDEHLGSIDITLVKQEASLSEHMKRSDSLEKMVNLLQSELKPIEKHVHAVDGVLKFLGALSILVGIAAAVKSIFF